MLENLHFMPIGQEILYVVAYRKPRMKRPVFAQLKNDC